MREILTYETPRISICAPQDAALVRACVSEIVAPDTEDAVIFEIRGPSSLPLLELPTA
jgi:hypothetical protein